VIPGFGLAFGVTLTWLSLIVLIPLEGVFWPAAEPSAADFWAIASIPRTLNAPRISFGTAFAAAPVNVAFGVLAAWAPVRYRFTCRKVVDARVDLPFALPTTTTAAGVAVTALCAPNGWGLPEMSGIVGPPSSSRRTKPRLAAAVRDVGLPTLWRLGGAGDEEVASDLHGELHPRIGLQVVGAAGAVGRDFSSVEPREVGRQRGVAERQSSQPLIPATASAMRSRVRAASARLASAPFRPRWPSRATGLLAVMRNGLGTEPSRFLTASSSGRDVWDAASVSAGAGRRDMGCPFGRTFGRLRTQPRCARRRPSTPDGVRLSRKCDDRSSGS
jgi:hypothetical protein